MLKLLLRVLLRSGADGAPLGWKLAVITRPPHVDCTPQQPARDMSTSTELAVSETRDDLSSSSVPPSKPSVSYKQPTLSRPQVLPLLLHRGGGLMDTYSALTLSARSLRPVCFVTRTSVACTLRYSTTNAGTECALPLLECSTQTCSYARCSVACSSPSESSGSSATLTTSGLFMQLQHSPA